MARTTTAVLAEIAAAIDEFRELARVQDDGARTNAAVWLDQLFAEVTSRSDLRRAATEALQLWVGMGSFSDVCCTRVDHAVERLRRALRAAQSWLLREG